MFLLLAFLGCNSDEVDYGLIEKLDVDQAAISKDVKKLCAALEMEDPEVRSYATKTIMKLKGAEGAEAIRCVSQSIKRPPMGWDEAIVKNFAGSKDRELARGLAKVIKTPGLENHGEAIDYYTKMPIAGEAFFKTLISIANNQEMDVEIRRKAMNYVGRNKANIQAIFDLTYDDDVKVQEYAIEILGRFPEVPEATEFIKKALNSKNPTMRAGSLKAFYKQAPLKADYDLCDAMKNDTSPVVRKAAIEAYNGIARRDPIRCLNKKANTLERDPDVREALLATLRSATGEAEAAAHKILCNSIPFWLKNYVKDDEISNLKGVDIVWSQNEVDHPNSLKCIERAFRGSSGYSCYAKMHIALWYKMVSEEDIKVPLCPDYETYSEPERESK